MNERMRYKSASDTRIRVAMPVVLKNPCMVIFGMYLLALASKKDVPMR